MSPAVQSFIEIGIQSCLEDGDLLLVDFTRVQGDYLHQEAHRTANGLRRCLPSPMMGNGAKLSFAAYAQVAEIYFSKPSELSRIIIRQAIDGRISTSGKGPSLLDFRAACEAANLDQRRDFARQGLRNEKTKVAKVFDYLIPKAA